MLPLCPMPKVLFFNSCSKGCPACTPCQHHAHTALEVPGPHQQQHRSYKWSPRTENHFIGNSVPGVSALAPFFLTHLVKYLQEIACFPRVWFSSALHESRTRIKTVIRLTRLSFPPACLSTCNRRRCGATDPRFRAHFT